MNKIIILDYSQVALANVFQFQTDLKKSNTDRENAVNIIRHAVLTGIKYYKKKYGREYGDMVIACDGKHYWRKSIFPHYKSHRKAAREKSDLDWKLIFDTISSIREDMIEHFPYKVVHLDRAEADDIIATLCAYTQRHDMIDQVMFADKQPVMIVSSDGDFKQLHQFDNVRQWSPMQKKLVQCDDPKAYLLEHIARGDSGDGIPNVLSADDTFITEGVRQTKMTAKRVAAFMDQSRDACLNDSERRNWDRNNTLINLENIPDDIRDEIEQAYISQKPKGDKMSVMNYLIKHRCRLLLDDIDDF